MKRSSLYMMICANLVGSIDAFGFATISSVPSSRCLHSINDKTSHAMNNKKTQTICYGWVQRSDGEWEWEENDPNYNPPVVAVMDDATSYADSTDTVDDTAFQSSVPGSKAAPKLPSGSFRPKQSLGQNFLQDGNTINKIVRSFEKDATETIKTQKGDSDIEGETPGIRAIELGPGAGALTGPLVEVFGVNDLQCIEIDPRSVELLGEEYPDLRVTHLDVMQVDYPAMAGREGGPLSVIGNLPYYITSQILFALADASHFGAVRSATVTMQWEVALRVVAPTHCKDYGILSVVFQLYADCELHFKIPPTVFYPKPKVDSALIGLRFIGPNALRRRLAGVSPTDLRRVVTTTFQQRRKTVRNTLKKLAIEACDGDKEAASALLSTVPNVPPSVLKAQEELDKFALTQVLPPDWNSKRPEELSSGQFIEMTRLIFGSSNEETLEFDKKVWRKLKHGKN